MDRLSSVVDRAQAELDHLSWGWKVTIPVLAGQAVVALVVLASPSDWWGKDWEILTEAGARITAGLNPYDVNQHERLRFSPLLAYFFAAIEPIGMIGWTMLSVAFLGILRDWRLIAMFVASLPFWLDIITGMTFAAVPVLAIAAVRGSFAAQLGFFALSALMPRPLMLPVLVWLLWRKPRARLLGVCVVVSFTVAAGFTGWADEWVKDLMTVAGSEDVRPVVQPLAWLGPLWFAMAGVGAWLTTRGHLGVASLAVSPYWNPSYFLLLLLEFPQVRRGITSSLQGHADVEQ